MLGEYVRRYVYWILDFLKGSKIRKNYNKVKSVVESNSQNLEQLESILSYARENVPFYKNIKENKIESFPIISKTDFMEQGDKLKSKEYLNRNDLHHVETSGSTGVPFKAVQDKIKRNMVIASLIYFHEQAGFKLGERYLFLRAWNSSHYSATKLNRIKQNYIAIDVVGMDDNRLEEIRNLLKKDKKIKAILSYASAIEVLVNYLEKKNDNASMFNVKTVLTGSDTLKPNIKEKAERILGCNVCDRYSAEEVGMLAMTYPKSNKFILNTAIYYFEIFKLDKDVLAEPGEIGRLVVTDLYNYAMPLIRYDTGDLVKSSDEQGKIITFDSLEGRTSDLLEDTNGNKISLSSINPYMLNTPGIEKYQIIQEDFKKYKILIVKRNSDFDENKCISEMKRCFGEDAIIKIEIVDKIESQKNGKYKVTIKKMGS